MNVDLTIQVNKLYDQYKHENANWKGIEEYFSQEEIAELKKNDDQNTAFKFKQFAVQHYALNKLTKVLESYVSKAYLFEGDFEKEFKEKYSKKVMVISQELANAGICFSRDQHEKFLGEKIKQVKMNLEKNDLEYAEKLPNHMLMDYSTITSN